MFEKPHCGAFGVPFMNSTTSSSDTMALMRVCVTSSTPALDCSARTRAVAHEGGGTPGGAC